MTNPHEHSRAESATTRSSTKTPLFKRPLTWVITVIVVIALAIGGFFVGSRIYADSQNFNAPAAFTTSDSSSSTESAAGEAGDANGSYSVSEGSEAGYRVDEVLNNEDVTVVGRTEDVTGEATIADGQLTKAAVTVKLSTVSTDSDRRDNYFRSKAIDTSQNPNAVFTLTAPVDVSALSDSGTAKVTAKGTLEINGQTKDAEVTLTLTRAADGTITAVGSSDVTWSDYGVEAPNLGFVSVEKTGTIEFSVVLKSA